MVNTWLLNFFFGVLVCSVELFQGPMPMTFSLSAQRLSNFLASGKKKESLNLCCNCPLPSLVEKNDQLLIRVFPMSILSSYGIRIPKGECFSLANHGMITYYIYITNRLFPYCMCCTLQYLLWLLRFYCMPLWVW